MAAALSFLSSTLLAPVQAVVLFFAPHAVLVRAPSPSSVPSSVPLNTSLETSITTSLKKSSATPSSMPRNGPFNTLALALSSQNAPGVTQSQALRVLRVSEPGAPAGCAGRMRMSGRFADVCAELDRMAAQAISAA